MRILVATVPFLLALPASGQRLLHSHTLPVRWQVLKMRSAGDVNGDGRLDVVAVVRDSTIPASPIAYLTAFSGLTGTPLYMVPDQTLLNAYDVFGFGDMNGDGRSDIAAITYSALRVYSGSSGAFLYSAPPPPSQGYAGGAGVGDYNANGTADLAIASYDNGLTTVRIVRGENGIQLANLATVPNSNFDVTTRAIGDINGDGRSEVAVAPTAGAATVLHGVSGAVLWSLTPAANDNNRSIETLDLDGDGRLELFFLRTGAPLVGATGLLTVHDPVSGAQLLAVAGTLGIGSTIAGLGDLDQDGRTDFAMLNFPQVLWAVSGGNGRRQWSLPGWQPDSWFNTLAGIGDVDGDGYGDFVVSSYHGAPADNHSVHLISGKVLAESQPQAGACGGGPFFPQLGATRPILGQTVTIAGQNGPPATPGILVFSLQPPTPVWLGASSCYAYFDLGGGIALAALSQPTWSLSLPLPLVPQLAGFEIALQSWSAPTTGPLGYDLSNGVWLRLGYQ